MFDKFRFDRDFFVWNLNASVWSSANTSHFHKGFFSFLDRMVLFLISLGLFFLWFFFFTGLSFTFDFSMSKDFPISKELPHVNFVKCPMQTKYANNLKNEPQVWVALKIPLGNLPRYKIMTPSGLINFSSTICCF